MNDQKHFSIVKAIPLLQLWCSSVYSEVVLDHAQHSLELDLYIYLKSDTLIFSQTH